MAALHVGSEKLLAGFGAVSGVPHARRPEGSADLWFGNLQEVVGKLALMIWNMKEAAVKQFTHFSYEILIVLEAP